MPKHIYDENGRYRGEILTDSEHNKRRGGDGRPPKCFICDTNDAFNDVEGAIFKKICHECNKLPKKRIKSYLKKIKKRNRRFLGFIFLMCILLREWNDDYPFENATYIGAFFVFVIAFIGLPL